MKKAVWALTLVTVLAAPSFASIKTGSRSDSIKTGSKFAVVMSTLAQYLHIV